MDGIENARHDLLEAACSLETAIDLLASIERDAEEDAALRELVRRLSAVKEELDAASSRLPASGADDNSPSAEPA